MNNTLNLVKQLTHYSPSFEDDCIFYEEYTDLREYRKMTKEKPLSKFEEIVMKCINYHRYAKEKNDKRCNTG